MKNLPKPNDKGTSKIILPFKIIIDKYLLLPMQMHFFKYNAELNLKRINMKHVIRPCYLCGKKLLS